VRCRTPVCAACTTRLDGVNHCHACLREAARPAQPRRAGPVLLAVASAALLAAAGLALFGVSWLAWGRLAP
jgi:hypothetical protein